MPKRIQRKRTKGWRKPEGTVNVARPSKWGNPYEWKSEMRTDGGCDWLADSEAAKMTAKERWQWNEGVAKAYVTWKFEFEMTEEQKQEIRDELRGKDLMCWCKEGDICHGDVLLKIANQ